MTDCVKLIKLYAIKLTRRTDTNNNNKQQKTELKESVNNLLNTKFDFFVLLQMQMQWGYPYHDVIKSDVNINDDVNTTSARGTLSGA